jgi:hypothetical protein
MGRQIDFEGYRRRLDGWDYHAKRHDVPRDMVALRALSDEIDFLQKIIVDREVYGE